MTVPDPERKRAYNREWRRRQHDLRELVGGRWFHPRAKHGTEQGYNRYGCRCRPCTDANTDKCRRY